MMELEGSWVGGNWDDYGNGTGVGTSRRRWRTPTPWSIKEKDTAATDLPRSTRAGSADTPMTPISGHVLKIELNALVLCVCVCVLSVRICIIM